MNALDHLIVAPILLPLAVAAAMLVLNEKRRRLKQVLSVVTAGALIAIAASLLHFTEATAAGTASLTRVYALGNWPAPHGIVLVVDRLSALMLVLANFLGFACLVYAIARWDRSGPRFHALFLFLLMGVNGAFLTGDIFNLFVFFEILLAASYGLALHGGGPVRTTASMHYIVINITASLLFLVGVSMIYAVTGTLNLADLARALPGVAAGDTSLLQSGFAILGIAFLVKAGMWPLGFWLPSTYGAAAPPAAAVFAILTKVGIYIVLRFTSLLLPEYPAFAESVGNTLKFAGMGTMIFGIVSLLASQTLSRVAGSYLVISSGTLLTTIGFGGLGATAGLLFYLVSSTLAASAMYLIIEPVERASVDDKAPGLFEPVFEDEYLGGPEDEEQETEIGVAISATVAMLGGGFILVALLLAGLPPLPSFLAKFTIIDALVGHNDSAATWLTVFLIIVSGLAALIAMTRAGIELLWKPTDRPATRINIIEATPIALLLATCIAMVIWAGPAMSYMQRTAQELDHPAAYIESVLGLPGAGGGVR